MRLERYGHKLGIRVDFGLVAIKLFEWLSNSGIIVVVDVVRVDSRKCTLFMM